jgi:hypothetical protein
MVYGGEDNPQCDVVRTSGGYTMPKFWAQMLNNHGCYVTIIARCPLQLYHKGSHLLPAER